MTAVGCLWYPFRGRQLRGADHPIFQLVAINTGALPTDHRTHVFWVTIGSFIITEERVTTGHGPCHGWAFLSIKSLGELCPPPSPFAGSMVSVESDIRVLELWGEGAHEIQATRTGGNSSSSLKAYSSSKQMAAAWTSAQCLVTKLIVPPLAERHGSDFQHRQWAEKLRGQR